LARAISVVNIRLMRAPAAFRCCWVALADAPIHALTAQDADLDFHHVQLVARFNQFERI
jgi:hypothetical protein